MTTNLLLSAVALGIIAVIGGCSKPAVPPIAQATPEPTPEPTPTPKPIAVVATPAPATPEPVPATPVPNYFAPEGVYFLMVKKSITTDDGITGVRPGTRLQKQADGSFTTDAGQTLQAAAHEVTNDLRVAQHIVGADAAASAALRQQMDARAIAEQQNRAETLRNAPAPVTASTVLTPRGTAARFAPPPAQPAGYQNPLSGGSYDGNRDKIYYDSAGTPFWKDAQGRKRYDIKK